MAFSYKNAAGPYRFYSDAPDSGSELTSGLDSLTSSYNRAYGEAKSANEKRYQQMLDTLRGGYDSALNTARSSLSAQQGFISQGTGQQAADIRSDAFGRGADIMQQLARTGMANTTVAPTMQAGVNRDMQSSLNRLTDQMIGTKVSTQKSGGEAISELQKQQAKDIAGAIERRTDSYPDLKSLQSLLGGITSQSGGGGISALIQALSQIRQ